MSDYEVRYSKPVMKYLKTLSKKNKKQCSIILKEISEIKKDPYNSDIMRKEFKGARKKRKGSYRIIFDIENKNSIILILKVGKRDKIYKNRFNN